jgi:hypothetical protein
MPGAPYYAQAFSPLPSRCFRLVAQVQVHPAALPLDLIDLAFAVVLAAGLEGEQLGVPGASGGLSAGLVLSCA